MSTEGEIIKNMRSAKGYSLRRLAQQTAEAGHHIEDSTIWSIEHGKRRATREQLAVLAKVLEANAIDLLVAGGYISSEELEEKALHQAKDDPRLEELISSWSYMSEDWRGIIYDIVTQVRHTSNSEEGC